jgi:hypothetical protein
MEAVQRVARPAHAIVRTGQLRAERIDPETVRSMVGATLQQTSLRGVYLVPACTDAWTPAARAIAGSSMLALGGRAAAAVYGWDGFERPDDRLLAEPPVVCPWTSRAELRAYRRRDLGRRDLRVVDGLRVAGPEWLLGHLEEDRYVDADRLEQAVECALRQGWVTEGTLRATAAARPASMLACVLGRRGPGAPPTGSLLETLTVQRVLRPFGIEVIARQVEVYAGREFVARPDFLLGGWTVLEVDGGQHLSDEHRRADRRRDLRLGSAGLLVIRVGPEEVASPQILATRLSDTVRSRTAGPPQAAASSPVANAAHSDA